MSKKAYVLNLLTSKDFIMLQKYQDQSPREFFTDYTSDFLEDMDEYIQTNQVFRINILGQTRSGKSEAGQTIAFLYTQKFNLCLKKNNFANKKFKENFKNSKIKISKLKFSVDNVYGNQSEYLYATRKNVKNRTLFFGQISLIDEAREMGGGLGSFTEYTELLNINNIIAKYCPSEVFCSPSKWVSDNAPYGLIARKKDFKNKVVWLQCFKLFNTEYGIDEVFVGWVGLPLHPYNKHRQLYEEKKNIWIEAEIEGNINDRLRLRHETAKKVAEDSRFMSCKNKKEQKILLENMIIEGKIQNFNNSEIQDIITNARMIKDDKTE